MRSIAILPALLLAAVAPAQTPEVVAKVDAKLDAERAAQRNEDVEVLRRLLNKSLGLDATTVVVPDPPQSYISSTAVPPVNALVNPHAGAYFSKTFDVSNLVTAWPTGKRVSPAVGPFDGVYLKGAGVVYTLRFPAGVDLTFDPKSHSVGVNNTCGQCHQGIVPHTTAHFVSFSQSAFRGDCNVCHTFSVPPATAKPPSEWEQMRQAVRGDKPKEPDPKKADKPRKTLCDPGSLTELLTAQLLAHARNVRHLGEKEAVTVVVTFDELPGVKGTAVVTPTGKPGFTPDEVQKLALGDLHVKQGKYAEAVAAYADGLARFTDKEWKLDGLTKMTPEQRKQYADEVQKGVRDAFMSYTKALLGREEKDRKEIQRAAEMVNQFVVLEVTPTTAKPVGPAKLILSVSKADAEKAQAIGDTLGSAPQALAAFKKVVTVERMNFPAAEEKQVK